MSYTFGSTEYRAAKGTHTATVIYLHGLGSSGSDIAQLVDGGALRAGDHIKYVFPNAPQRPVTLNMGAVMPAWFDLPMLGPDMYSKIDWAGHNAAMAHLNKLIEEETKAGIPTERIVVGGFSQGGNVAVRGALAHPEKLAGVLINSTFLGPPLQDPQTPLTPTPANKNINALWCHGQADPMVPMQVSQMDSQVLKNVGVSLQWLTYPGLTHSLNPDVIRDMTAFLMKHIPASGSAAPAAAAVTAEDVSGMSVKELKVFITSKGGNPATCFEKSELVSLANTLI
eukprot:CAMPEP_0197851212 /NCGR_PEP_ID=MMETSP1438-20131217/17538_1 /TAXON_ID=1461541 /ORGANISM="Pterosperma sp., Strain CCMP1384" /LENGTH=282 /DNA_ID=CAMNT_0043464739 /DNA_START=162 /DNA_END=1010 /DNA_ORIENTATION=-